MQQLVLEIPEVIGRELHELVMSAGMKVLAKMLEAEREQLCGPRYAHSSSRKATRGGHAPGELALGGRRVSVSCPRVRGREVALRPWDLFAGVDALNERALEQMVIGVSTRKYARSLEDVDLKTRGTSKSAASRRFVALTQARLDEMMKADLSKIDVAALMIDGIAVGKHVVLVALGIDVDGPKHIIGIHEGATENAAACTALLASLRERGMRTDRTILVVIDGSKALRKAVTDVFGNKAVVQRLPGPQEPKRRRPLPDSMHASVRTAMAQAYKAKGFAAARSPRESRALQKEHPSAAASIREGLDETLTIKRFKLPDALVRTLSTTNAIENVNSGIRRVCKRVTTWEGGMMVLRWVGAAVVEHGRGFRRLRGHAGMGSLVAAVRALDTDLLVAEKEIAA